METPDEVVLTESMVKSLLARQFAKTGHAYSPDCNCDACNHTFNLAFTHAFTAELREYLS